MIAAAKLQLPTPAVGEHPTHYADRIGQQYAELLPLEKRRSQGQFFTPVEIADFMAQLYSQTQPRQQILDPGAGTGILACAVCEALATSGHLREVSVEAYESDAVLAEFLKNSLAYLSAWLRQKGVTMTFQIFAEDFVLANAEGLAEKTSLFITQPSGKYDLVIANPPYFKLPKSDKRARVAEAIVCGQPNMYAIFMAVSASLLKENGQIICITPRSYTAGGYFRLFREKFFARMRPLAVHLFDSRKEAFGRNEVLQESLILQAERVHDWVKTTAEKMVTVSRSAGWQDLATRKIRQVTLNEVLDVTQKEMVLHLPSDEQDQAVMSLVRQWPGSLHRYGLEISTGPVVPFRATEFIGQDKNLQRNHAPLLWMQNVTSMQIAWPVTSRNKAQYILANELSRSLLVKNRNYVLLRRFSPKEAARRLVAAPLLAHKLAAPFVGLENHLNYVHRPKGEISIAEAYGLAGLFNSTLIDHYFRIFNGNTQISATELRALPLPPLPLIEELGHQLMTVDPNAATIDDLVNQLFNPGRGETHVKD